MSSVLKPMTVEGTTVWFEVEEHLLTSAPRDAGIKLTGRSGPSAETSSAGGAAAAVGALENVDIASTLAAVIRPVHAALKAVAPQEVSVELSLGIKGEVGVFVAKSEANAALKITAKWMFESPESPAVSETGSAPAAPDAAKS